MTTLKEFEIIFKVYAEITKHYIFVSLDILFTIKYLVFSYLLQTQSRQSVLTVMSVKIRDNGGSSTSINENSVKINCYVDKNV